MIGEIRALDIEDYADLMALWRLVGLESLKPNGRDSRRAVARQLESGVQTILGPESEGELVGAAIATHDSRRGWINRLAVDPAHRRRGYGARLVAVAEEVLLSQGIRVKAALVQSDNAASLALLRGAGYVDAGAHIHYLSKRDSEEVQGQASAVRLMQPLRSPAGRPPRLFGRYEGPAPVDRPRFGR